MNMSGLEIIIDLSKEFHPNRPPNRETDGQTYRRIVKVGTCLYLAFCTNQNSKTVIEKHLSSPGHIVGGRREFLMSSVLILCSIIHENVLQSSEKIILFCFIHNYPTHKIFGFVFRLSYLN